jgi:hypothetical protein
MPGKQLHHGATPLAFGFLRVSYHVAQVGFKLEFSPASASQELDCRFLPPSPPDSSEILEITSRLLVIPNTTKKLCKEQCLGNNDREKLYMFSA